MQRLEADQMLNRARNYAQSSLSQLIIEHKDF